MQMQGREAQPSWRSLSLRSFRWRDGRRGIAGHLCDHVFGLNPPLVRQVANVDYHGWLEGPGERLHPRHHRHEADPTHQVDRLSFGMVARDGYSSGKTKHEHDETESDDS